MKTITTEKEKTNINFRLDLLEKEDFLSQLMLIHFIVKKI